MTTRILPQAEWPRLSGTEAETLWPYLNPANSQVLVVEEEEKIIGCWVLMQVLHAECVYIAPEHRQRSSVARRLLRGMKQLAYAAGMGGVYTAAISDDVKQLLAKLGATRVPGDPYMLTFKGSY